MTPDDHWVALGWDDGWERALASLPGRPARIARVDRGRLRILERQGPVSVDPPLDGPPLVTGDWVACADDGDRPVVVGRAERRTELVRRDPAEEPRPQVLAANMDQVWVVHAVDQPLRAGWLDRALVVAFGSGGDPLVVVTKADVRDPAPVVDEVAALAPGVPVVTVSVVGRRGITDLAARLDCGRCAALLGRSGAGKSSLVNALAGVSAQRTGAVRGPDARGRHTTTRRALARAAGGTVIDTPGVRALGLWESAVGLAGAFPEIAELAPGCHFADCRHSHEPGCAVRAAVEAGTVDRSRYDRYIALSS